MIKPNLWQKLAVVTAALMLACCMALLALQMRANTRHEQEVVQRLSLGLAEHIAQRSELMDTSGMRDAAVRALFGQLMAVNPSVEVYLLDDQGRILGHDAPSGHLVRTRVDVAPLRRLLAGAPLPILGDDPRSADGRKVFSAAPLIVQGRQAGYVYVVLVGEHRQMLADDLAAGSQWNTTLWSVALVGGLGLLAGLVAFYWVTRPLRRLTRRIQAFDIDAPTPLPPAEPLRPGERDELVILEHAHAQMAQRLGEQWQLRQQDLQRRELVANISHDLRTPLSSLHGYLETLALKDATLSPDERRRYLGIAWHRVPRSAGWRARCSSWRGWSMAKCGWSGRCSHCRSCCRTCCRSSNWRRRRVASNCTRHSRPACRRCAPTWPGRAGADQPARQRAAACTRGRADRGAPARNR